MSESTELVVRAPYQPQSLDEVQKLGEAMAASGFFKDTRQAAQAVVKVLAGQELGIPPVAAMRGIHVVEGKLELSGTLTAALIKRHAAYDYRVDESTDEKCVIRFLQHREEVGTVVWTLDDAKRAGLAGSNNWRKYPRAMLFNRAMTEGARMHCPDVFDGPIYAEGEVSEAVAGELEGADELAAEASGADDDVSPSDPPESAPDPTSEVVDVVEGEVVDDSEGDAGAPAGEAEGEAATSAGDPHAEIEALVERLGWNAGKLLKFARDAVGKHLVKPIARDSISDDDAVKLVEALRTEVAS